MAASPPALPIRAGTTLFLLMENGPWCKVSVPGTVGGSPGPASGIYPADRHVCMPSSPKLGVSLLRFDGRKNHFEGFFRVKINVNKIKMQELFLRL